MENDKLFDLGTVLSITTQRLFANIDDIDELLDFLTGVGTLSPDLSLTVDSAKFYVLSRYPQLKGVGDDVEIRSYEDAKAFVEQQKRVYGDKLPLSPMPKTVDLDFGKTKNGKSR